MDQQKTSITERRIFLKGTAYLSIATLLQSCNATQQIEAFGAQLNAQFKDAQLTPAQRARRDRIQNEALRRINTAIQLTTLDFGMTQSQFDKAEQLYLRNFLDDVAQSNPNASALSKLFWVNLVLQSEREKQVRNLGKMRTALEEADVAFDQSAKKTSGIILANAGMTISLMHSDFSRAERWFNDHLRFINEGLTTDKTSEGLHKEDVYNFFHLGACVASMRGNNPEAWRRFESGAAISRSASFNTNTYTLKSSEATRKSLTKAMESLDALVGFAVTPAFSLFLICKNGNRGLEYDSFNLRIDDGSAFTTQSAEVLLYGKIYKRNFIDSSLGGWMGAYAATDDQGSLSLSQTFYQNLPRSLNINAHWVTNNMRQALSNAGIQEESNIGLLLPDKLKLMPLRSAVDRTSGRPLFDYYHIAQIPSLSVFDYSKNRAPKPSEISVFFNSSEELRQSKIEKVFVESVLPLNKVNEIVAKQTAGSFIDNISKNNSAYVLISTHGNNNMNDLSSGKIEIGNNQFLVASDLLSSRKRIDAELVVLSACEVGGISDLSIELLATNLSTSFLKLGAKAVLAALWRVEVNATALITCKVLEQRVRYSVSGPAALSKAQSWLRDATADDILSFLGTMLMSGTNEIAVQRLLSKISRQYKSTEKPYSHPFYWAGFVYFGS
jgi:CHAT domain-containing protein